MYFATASQIALLLWCCYYSRFETGNSFCNRCAHWVCRNISLFSYTETVGEMDWECDYFSISSWYFSLPFYQPYATQTQKSFFLPPCKIRLWKQHNVIQCILTKGGSLASVTAYWSSITRCKLLLECLQKGCKFLSKQCI